MVHNSNNSNNIPLEYMDYALEKEVGCMTYMKVTSVKMVWHVQPIIALDNSGGRI